jgi:hypothetical protein
MPNRKRNNNKKSNKPQFIPTVNGQGGYWTDTVLPALQKTFPKGTFSNAGGAVGGALGSNLTGGSKLASNVGSRAGRYLGSSIAKIVGFGDYNVVGNSLSKIGSSLPEGYDIPSFGNANHETVIRHREYVGDVVVPSNPTAFNLTQYKINAGNSTLFPWLAAVAARYQQYRVNGMIIEYKTMSSDITAGGALGTVILATNYDAIAVNFQNKVQMENSQYACSAKPSRSQIHAIECDPSITQSKLLYVRDSSQSSAVSDDRFYDLGHFQIATQGLPGTTGQTLGELWVSYDISLFKPDLDDPLCCATASLVGATSVSKTAPFGTAPVVTGDGLFTAGAGNSVIFKNAGTYLLNIFVIGGSLLTPTFNNLINVQTPVNKIYSTGTDVLRGSYQWWVTVTSAGGLMAISTSASTTVTGFSLTLTKVDDFDGYAYAV